MDSFTDPWSTGVEPDVEAGLGALAAEDATTAERAAWAFEALTAGGGLETLTQYGLQCFLWYELPRQQPTDVADQLADVQALGRLLHRLGLPRYAAVCHGPDTETILAAAACDRGQALRLFRRAMERSGLEPPPVGDVDWSAIMGSAEASAFRSVADALELAVACGVLRPGVRGWRRAQRQLAWRHLTSGRDREGTDDWRSAILEERRRHWIEHGGERRRVLVAPVASRLLHPVDVPDGALESVAPLRWLLEAAGDGIPLTQRHNLGRAFVLDAAGRFGWVDEWGVPRGEDDLYPLWQWHRLARHLAAVRRRGRRLLRTAEGTRLLADDDALWRATVRSVCAGEDWSDAVSELALAVLLDRGRVPIHQMAALLGPALADCWRDADGGPPTGSAVTRALDELTGVAELLWLVDRRGQGLDGTMALTPVGVAGAVEALRARATRPRRSLRPA